MEIDFTSLDGALVVLGQLLADRGHYYEIVVVGGGSLLLLGLMDRPTRDLDLVGLMEEDRIIPADPLPQPLIQTADEVGRALELGRDWLNIGPASLLKMGLPAGFISRLHMRDYKGLTVYLADRFDQICFKLYAAVDQGPRSKHFADLVHLHPTTSELEQARCWCVTQDVSISFAEEMSRAVESINAASG